MGPLSSHLPIRTIETRAGVFDLLDGGIVRFTSVAGGVFDANTAQHAQEAVEDLTAGRPFVIVADARNLGYANWGARKLLAGAHIEGRVATAAVLSSRVLVWLADKYVRQIGSRRLIRVFDTEDQAYGWAVEQLRLAQER